MLFRGNIIVPPTCPAVVGKWDPGDLGKATMLFQAKTDSNDTQDNPVTEALLSFFTHPDPNADEDDPFLDIKALEVPYDPDPSSFSGQICALAADTTKCNRLQKILKDRVANCQGVQPNGECWALGPTALAEAITLVMNEDPPARPE